MKFLGTDIQRQSDSASAFAGGGSVDPLDLTASIPAAPAAGTLRLYRQAIGGRQMPGFLGPIGLGSAVQPLMARNRITVYLPAGGNTTFSSLGAINPTTSGTPTAYAMNPATLLGRVRRAGWTSLATAGQFSGFRVSFALITTGTTISGVPVGGFFKVLRFAISDAAPVAGARMFCGIQADTAAPTNIEPATQINCIGVGHGAADTNLKLFNAGSVAQTPIDLGANYPITPGSAYELVLYCPAGSAFINWQVTRLDAIITPASGTLSGTAGTAIPGPSTLMSYCWNWRCNNTTALTTTWDLISDYIETD